MDKEHLGILPNELSKMQEKYHYLLFICNLSSPKAPSLKITTYSKESKAHESYFPEISTKELMLKQYELLANKWELYDWTENENVQKYFYKKNQNKLG